MFERITTTWYGSCPLRGHDEFRQIADVAYETEHEVLPSPSPASFGEVQGVVEVVYFDGTGMKVSDVHTTRSTKTFRVKVTACNPARR